MKSILFRVLIAMIAALFSHSSIAKEQSRDVRSYIFGNSLIHHKTASDETSVPHWLHHLAKTAGNRFSLDGQWGFLRNFVTDLPPTANWSFKDVSGVWNSDVAPFKKSRFNTILVNPANFIQYQAPDQPYDGKNPNNQSPLGATLTLFDWIAQRKPGLAFYIYEGWADMGTISPKFPPTAAQITAFHALNLGEYHIWYLKYLKQVQQNRPKLNITLVPVASLLSKLLTKTKLRALKPHDLYSDTAPHGTATTYFLAAVITYSVIYNRQAPTNFRAPQSIHRLVRDNYKQLINLVCAEVVKDGDCPRAAN